MLNKLRQQVGGLVKDSLRKKGGGSKAKWLLVGKITLAALPIIGYAFLIMLVITLVISVYTMIMSPIDTALAFITGSKEDTSVEKLDEGDGKGMNPEDFGFSPEELSACIESTGANVKSIGATVDTLGQENADPLFVVDYATYVASFLATPDEETAPTEEPPGGEGEEAVEPVQEDTPAYPDTYPEDTPADEPLPPAPEEGEEEAPTTEEPPQPADPANQVVSPEEYATHWNKTSLHGLPFLQEIRPGIPTETARLLYLLSQRAVATSGHYPEYKAPSPYDIAALCDQEFGGKQGR